MPTEQCNFRCTYCYEDFALGRMSNDVIEAVKRFLDHRLDSLSHLNISWFGGEPLLAQSVIEDISGFIVGKIRDITGLVYAGDITTNGYTLGPKEAQKLCKVGVTQFQISLDGPREMHDSTRLRINGMGSYDRIWRNLLSLRESDLPIRVMLRVHLTPENLDRMPDFLRLLNKTFLADKRFSVLLRPIEHMGGANDSAFQILSRATRESAMDSLNEILATPDRSSDVLAEAPVVCYAAKPNSLVIRSDGSLSKCTVALDDPSNNIGQLLHDGSLQIDGAKIGPWFRGWSSQDSGAVACPYVGLPRSEPELLQLGVRPD